MRFLSLLLVTFTAFAQPPRPTAGPLHSGEWRGRPITYNVVDGYATSGDILIARVNSEGALPRNSGAATKTWTGGVIPYVFDSTVTNRARLLASMKAWADPTGIQFVDRTNQANYLKIVSPTFGCNSYVGMQGGAQVLNIADGCLDGAATHELGHAIGLFHEHSRLDRDQWVEIHRENIIVTCPYEADFALAAGSTDLLGYDYGSVMHYDGWNNTRNFLPSIVTIPPYIPIGEAASANTGPSQTDIESVRQLYGKPPRGTTIDTFPVGQPIVVDGVSYTAPHTFQWAEASTHTVSVPDTVPVDADTRLNFARWSDNGGRQHTVIASAVLPVYSASFVRSYRTRTTNPAHAVIKLSPASPDGFYPQNSYVTVNIELEAGYTLYGWSGVDIFPLSMPEEGYPIGLVNPRVINIVRPRTLTAIIADTKAAPVLVTTDPPNATVKIDGSARFTPSLPDPGPHRLEALPTIEDCGSCEGRTARLVFDGWVGRSDKNPILDVPAPTPGATVVTYVAKYKKQYPATITVLGNGKVDLSPPPTADGFYDEGTVIRATPQPGAGLRFYDWYGLPGNLDALYLSDAPTYNKCSNPLIYRMTLPLVAMAEMTTARPSGAKPAITAAGVLNAASGAGNGVSPGEIVTFYGQKLGPAALVPGDSGSAGYFDNCVARTIVSFDGVPAPILYTYAGQVSVIVPYGVATKSSTQVTLEYADNRSDTLTIPVVAAKPAFFTANASGKGAGAFLDLNYRLITSINPVVRGSYAQLYATGAGQTNPVPGDGALALDFAQLPKPVLPVRVFVGGVEAEVVYAGAAPGLVAGLLQVNVRLPENTPAGDAVPIVLQVGAIRSPDGVTIAVR
jgi:uncharacterized protein (TIGR03437 family)